MVPFYKGYKTVNLYLFFLYTSISHKSQYQNHISIIYLLSHHVFITFMRFTNHLLALWATLYSRAKKKIERRFMS